MTAISNANLPVSNGSGDAALAHITSNRVIGSTTIATDTIANWPSFFIATTGTLLSSGFIDPTTKTDFYGHLGTGNQLIIDGFCPGNSDNGNTSSQVVVIKPNTEWANLIAQGVQSTSLFPADFPNYVEATGAIWSQTSGLAGTQTNGYAWYSGVRYSIPAVTTYTFTANQDTYIDVNPTTGAYTYIPVANFANEPAMTANSVRVAKVVTGASAITAVYQKMYNSPLTAKSVQNTVEFSATITGAQSMGNATWAKAPFNSVATANGFFDNNAQFDTTNNRFHILVPGRYQFNMNMGTSQASGSHIVVGAFYKNGSPWTYSNAGWSANAANRVSLGALINLVAGDYIEVWNYSDAPLSFDTSSGASNQFSGFLKSQN